MGQTLTHGVYLPDEGERNCYSGLAANWQLLDNSVGTIADHTTALAGKAPAVHTHTVSDITDLFNSENTWSANNTYSANCIIYNSDNSGSVATLRLRNSKAEVLSTGNTASDQSITFRDKNDVAISYIRGAVQSNGAALRIGATARDSSNNTVDAELQLLAFSNGYKAIFPSTTNAYALGTSSYQWNNVYSKGYYYNGTAWGLDKANEWSKTQGFVGENQGTELSSNYNTCFGMYGVKDTVGKSGMFFTKYRPNRAQGSLTASDIIQYGVDALENEVRTNNVFDLQVSNYDSNTGEFTKINVVSTLPNANLGTSTNKWKSLNGINPGALSLPKTESGKYSFTELSSISGIGVDNWVLDGGKIVIAAEYVITGWLYVCIACDTDGYVILQTGGYSYPNCFYKVTGTPIAGYASATIPIVEGIALVLYLKGTSLLHARYYPAAGNV